MRKLSSSLSRQLPRCLWAAPAALLLVFSSQRAQAQATEPKQAWAWVRPGTLMYLDGKPSTLTEIRQLDNDAISSGEGVEIVSKDSTNQPFGNFIAPAAEIITTKANANSPAVLALADRLDLRSGYTEQPATLRAVAPPALAYITSHYPQAWLAGQVTELRQKSTGAVRYRVLLADRWSLFHVDFTPEGEVIEHPFAAPIPMLLVLTLSYPHAPVQTNPVTGLRIGPVGSAKPTGPLTPRVYAPVYLNGRRISQETLKKLNPDSLASTVILRQEVGQLLDPEAAGLGLLVITTKRGQRQPFVAAFTKRVHQLEVLQKLTAHSYQAPAATAATAPALPGREATEIRYYLNSKPIDEATMEKLDPNTIASVEVLPGAQALAYAHDLKVGGVVLLKTKQLPGAEADSLRGKSKRMN